MINHGKNNMLDFSNIERRTLKKYFRNLDLDGSGNDKIYMRFTNLIIFNQSYVIYEFILF